MGDEAAIEEELIRFTPAGTGGAFLSLVTTGPFVCNQTRSWRCELRRPRPVCTGTHTHIHILHIHTHTYTHLCTAALTQRCSVTHNMLCDAHCHTVSSTRSECYTQQHALCHMGCDTWHVVSHMVRHTAYTVIHTVDTVCTGEPSKWLDAQRAQIWWDR